MFAEELLERYQAGERNFAGVDLVAHQAKDLDVWVQLGRADFRGINLRGANLYRVSFGHADLRGANLAGAYLGYGALGYANFQDACLQGAAFTVTNMRGANFTRADLRDATFRETRMVEVVLTGADLEFAIFIGADLTDAIGWKQTARYCTFLSQTTMPDGRLEVGPTILE